MLTELGRELKDNVGDQLRSVRHMVRVLGSGAPRIRVADKTLPEIPAELDRFVGRTFRAVDGVMTAVETIAAPFLSTRPSDPSSRPIDAYFVGGGASTASDAAEQALQDDVYVMLKLVAEHISPNQLILKTRLSGLQQDMLSSLRAGKWDKTDASSTCSALFLALVRRRPIISDEGMTSEERWKQYAAASLVFGLASFGALSDQRPRAIIGEVVMMSGLRADAFIAAAKANVETDALRKTFASLLSHLP